MYKYTFPIDCQIVGFYLINLSIHFSKHKTTECIATHSYMKISLQWSEQILFFKKSQRPLSMSANPFSQEVSRVLDSSE